MHRQSRYLFLLLILLFVAPSLPAQLNLGIGYSLGYINPKADRAIFEQFNEDRPWLEDELEPINALQGFHVGLRYKFDFIALEFTWRNRFRTKRGNGIDPATSLEFRRDVTHRYTGYSIGVENFIKDFSYGASIEVENFAMRTEVTGVEEDFTIISHYGLGSQFFVSYRVDAGNALSFSIRPYIHIPWQSYDIAKVAEEINGTNTSGKLDTNYMNIGVMFIFYNGRQ